MKPLTDTFDFYAGDYGYLSNFINNYESIQQPSTLHLTNTVDYHMFFRYFLQRAMSGIIFDGIPDHWDADYFRYVLLLTGNIAVINTKQFGIIPQQCNPYGFDVFYRPTNVMITNPAFDNQTQTDYKISQDTEVIRLTPDWRGIADLISTYAQRMALIWSTHDVSTALSKMGYLFIAKNKSTAETFKVLFDDIMSGKLAVATSQALYDKDGKQLYQMFDNDVSKNYDVATQALANLETLKSAFDAEIGLITPPEKKERLITSEIVAQTDGIMSKIELWVDTLNQTMQAVNRMFGLNLSAKLRNPKRGDSNESIDTADESLRVG